MPDRAYLLVIVCVYEQKRTIFIKSLDINKILPTLISTDMATPPRQPRAATYNSLREIKISLCVKPPVSLSSSIRRQYCGSL